MEIHGSARRHGVSDGAIRHTTSHAVVVVDLEPEGDPPKQLVIGADPAGNLVEVIVLLLSQDRLLAIHAMPLRRAFRHLLPGADDFHG